MPKLKPKQEAFVNEYLVDMNGARAARAVGYSENTARQIANENLTKPDIKKRIAEKLQERAREADGSFEWMQDRLIYAAERCSSDDDFNPHGLVQTVGLLAKLKGFMTDKVQLEANVNNRHSMDIVRLIEVDETSQRAFETIMDRHQKQLMSDGS